MRDQNFQNLMNDFAKRPVQDHGPQSVSEASRDYEVGEAKISRIEEALDNQLAFKEFLKRSLPTRKPTSEFIQSLKDRIKIIDTIQQ